MNKSLGIIYAFLFFASINLVHAVSIVTPDETGGNLHDPERLVQNLPEGQEIILNRTFSELPLMGETDNIPWVGGYWPKYLDSVNYLWDGPNSISAIEKYNQAFEVRDFSGNPVNLEHAISQKLGIEGRRYAYPRPRQCSSNSPYCGGGQRCAIPRGETEGICIDSWAGICHAWASAAITEPEPVEPVTVNGITFKVNDLKALTTLMYTQGRKKNYLSFPCKKSDARGEIKYDQWGRPSANDFECADTNPATFHIVAVNFLGIHKRAFVEDRIFDEEIWNQPVRAFTVTETKELTAEEAMQLMAEYTSVNDIPSEYIFNGAAKRFQYVDMTLSYIAESALTTDGNLADQVDRYTRSDRYEYILEMDEDGGIIGGEWVRGSKRKHPDFLTLTYGRSNQSMVGYIKWEEVKKMLMQSVNGEAVAN